MADDKAKIKIDVEGAAEAERKLKTLQGAFKDWGREVSGAVAGMARDLASTSMALSRVDPGGAAERFRSYRRTVTEQSIAVGRSVEDMRRQFSGLANSVVLPDEQVAAFSTALSKSTKEAGDSRKAIEALRGSGLAANKSLEEMGAVAETLHNSMGLGLNDVPAMLDRIEASAKSLGTTGGPSALMDQLTALGGALSQVSTNGKRSAGDLVAVLAAVGKGRTLEGARQVQGDLVSRFTQGGEQMRLNLGIKRQDFYDENGNVRVNAQNVQRLRDFYLKRTGGDVERAKSLASFGGNLGPQLASALFRPGLMEDIKKAATTEAPGSGAAALDALRKSGHGVDEARAIERERRTREEVGGAVNAAQQGAAGLLPDNPWARAGVMGVGGAVAGKAFDQAMGFLGKSAGEAAGSLFKVGEAGGKAQLVLAGMGQGGSAVPAAAGAAALAGPAAVGAGALVYSKTEAAVRDAALNAVSSERDKAKARSRAGENPLVNDLAAGRKRLVEHWYGGSYENVPAGEQAAEANKYRSDPRNKDLLPEWARKPVEVTVKIEDSSGHPNQVVQVAKGQAGRQ